MDSLPNMWEDVRQTSIYNFVLNKKPGTAVAQEVEGVAHSPEGRGLITGYSSSHSQL